MEDIIREDKRHKLNRPITGIIQKDRIWEQWYDPSIFSLDLPKMTQKDYLFKCIGDEKDRIIINNRGKMTYSVGEFEQLVLEYEKAFAACGVQKGDIICTIGLSTPEMYAIKYAATSLGVITCNLNVLEAEVNDNDRNRLFNQIANVNPKMIFTLDILEDRVSHILNSPSFSNIVKVSMPLTKSTPIYNPERVLFALKRIKDAFDGKKVNNNISLDDFLSLGKAFNIDDLDEQYSEKMPCNISYTSGTTGINKAVLLSHDANNALAFQQQIAELGYRKDSKQLTLVPPFLAFWDSAVVHVALCVKAQNIIELSLDNDKIPKYFLKYKGINCGMWSQFTWNALLQLPKEKLEEIRKDLYLPIIGGERNEVNAANAFYEKSGIRFLAGYGASEVNTTFSFNHPYCNKLGSSGLPLPFNNVKIVNDSFNDVTYNQPGRLLISSPCLMNGYFKNESLTSNVIHIDEDGTKWYYTGDYAVMDQDGCLTVLDRYSEPITINIDNKESKINLSDVNEVIKRNAHIKISKVTYDNKKLVLHLVLLEDINISKDEAIEEIKEYIRASLPEELWPDFINLEEELTRTPVGKVDYKVLAEKGKYIADNYMSDEKMFTIDNYKNELVLKMN